jgi:hypothetical protein
MSKQIHLCPFLKKTCVACSLYRGRHTGLVAPGSSSDGADWMTALDAFFKDVSAMPDAGLDTDEL